MALHDLTDDIALPLPKDAGQSDDDDESLIPMPSLMRASYAGMRADGVYFIGDAFNFIVDNGFLY